jgi:hypothetical protein
MNAPIDAEMVGDSAKDETAEATDVALLVAAVAAELALEAACSMMLVTWYGISTGMSYLMKRWAAAYDAPKTNCAIWSEVSVRLKDCGAL